LKKNVIYALVIFALALLLANIFITSSAKKNSQPVRTENYRYEIDSVFISALSEYDLEKSWIKKIPVNNKKNDSVKYVYQISIPKDISVAELAGDINSYFIDAQSTFVSEELSNYGKTEIRIYSGGKMKLQAFVKTKKNLARVHSKIALLVDCSKISDKKPFDDYAGFSFNFTLLLLPSFQSFMIKEKLIAADKNYAVLLSNEIEEKKYRLGAGYSKPVLQKSVKNLVSDFNDASLFVIDKESDIYNSPSFNFVKEEFSKRGETLLRKDRFKMLTLEDSEEALSLFNFFTAGKDSSVTHRILISPENFKLLLPKIKSSVKKGVKFVKL